MAVFAATEFADHEHVSFIADRATGLRAIIAIHNTALGPAMGGCRMWPYRTEAEALADALRLSRGMTYKCALAGLAYGGGKAVIIGDARADKTPALLRAMGRAVDALGGRYITAEDVGTTVRDMDRLREVTAHARGVSHGTGNPSPATAWGVYAGIRAAVAHRTGRADVAGLTVAVQGLGNVGRTLATYLARDGARLVVADIDAHARDWATAALGAEAVEPDRLIEVEADVFAPCALGAVINDETVPRLRAGIVAGAANNQLAAPRHGDALAARGILYAPDYVINAGGVIDIAAEGPDYDADAVLAAAARIGETLRAVLARSEREGRPPHRVADRMAEERFLGRSAEAA